MKDRLIWRCFCLLLWAIALLLVIQAARASWLGQVWWFDGDPERCLDYGVYGADSPRGPWRLLNIIPQRSADGTGCECHEAVQGPAYIIFVPLWPDGTPIDCTHGNQVAPRVL